MKIKYIRSSCTLIQFQNPMQDNTLCVVFMSLMLFQLPQFLRLFSFFYVLGSFEEYWSHIFAECFLAGIFWYVPYDLTKIMDFMGKKNTEIKCYSHYIISRVLIVSSSYYCWDNLDQLFLSHVCHISLFVRLLFFPLCSPWKKVVMFISH